jgi:hypothetical protein
MALNYPKFDKRINDKIDESSFKQLKNRPGTIMVYNASQNTATVLVDEKYSDLIGNMLPNVPCPFIYGVQSVAPAPGTRCLVAFRDAEEKQPYIVMYFNETHSHKNTRNNAVDTGIPKFLA